MNSVCLTVNQVEKIHAVGIERFGGSGGMLNRGNLESALGRLQTGYYTDVVEEAAALMESLATNHAFLDGNKRVAFFSTSTFLKLNGYRIVCEANEADKFVRDMLEMKSDRFDKTCNWIRSRVVRMEQIANP